MEWERRLALSFDDTVRFLDWVGDATPGSEYKWLLDRSEYERERERVEGV